MPGSSSSRPSSGSADRAAIVAAFESWLDVRQREPQLRFAAELLLDWRAAHSNGPLTSYRPDELDEFLLEWCPRTWAAERNDWTDLIMGLVLFMQCLLETGLWTADELAGLRAAAHIADQRDAFASAMSDPANFGIGKTILSSSSGQGPDLDDPASIQRAIEQYNALPFEARRALTDQVLARSAPTREEYLLPPLRRPSPAAIVASAAANPLLLQIVLLREYLGSAGRPLTQRGNLRLADCQALVELLRTGDSFHSVASNTASKTASITDLPKLDYAVEIAKRARAVRVVKSVMLPVKKWPTDPIEAASAIASCVIDAGVLSIRHSVHPYLASLREVLDSGLPYLLTDALAAPGPCPIDALVSMATAAASLAGQAPAWVKVDDWAVREINVMLSELARLGVCTLDSAEFRMTAFGQHFMMDWLRGRGFEFDEYPPLEALSADLLLATFAGDADTVEETWMDWQPTWTDEAKVSAIAEALLDAPGAWERVSAMGLLACRPDAAEPHVRALLEFPVIRGSALAWLLGHGLITEAEVAALGIPRLDLIAPLVDSLWMELETGDAESMFELMQDDLDIDGIEALLNDFAAVGSVEAAEVLEVISAEFPDKRVAKSARRALHKIRSRR